MTSHNTCQSKFVFVELRAAFETEQKVAAEPVMLDSGLWVVAECRKWTCQLTALHLDAAL